MRHCEEYATDRIRLRQQIHELLIDNLPGTTTLADLEELTNDIHEQISARWVNQWRDKVGAEETIDVEPIDVEFPADVSDIPPADPVAGAELGANVKEQP